MEGRQNGNIVRDHGLRASSIKCVSPIPFLNLLRAALPCICFASCLQPSHSYR
jgi:hypothetical protein